MNEGLTTGLIVLGVLMVVLTFSMLRGKNDPCSADTMASKVFCSRASCRNWDSEEIMVELPARRRGRPRWDEEELEIWMIETREQH